MYNFYSDTKKSLDLSTLLLKIEITNKTGAKMNKKQLIVKLSGALNLSKADSERTFDTITNTILDALKAISSEINLSVLVKKTLTIIIEHAGAQKGILLIRGEDNSLKAEAFGTLINNEIHSHQNLQKKSMELQEFNTCYNEEFLIILMQKVRKSHTFCSKSRLDVRENFSKKRRLIKSRLPII